MMLCVSVVVSFPVGLLEAAAVVLFPSVTHLEAREGSCRSASRQSTGSSGGARSSASTRTRQGCDTSASSDALDKEVRLDVEVEQVLGVDGPTRHPGAVASAGLPKEEASFATKVERQSASFLLPGTD